MTPRRFSITELAQVAGISGRTVRYYVQRGLIPPPDGRGPGRHYGQEHLDRILKLRDLQRTGLSLDLATTALTGRACEPVPDEPIERELVTRLKLGDGLHLEVGPGTPVPTDRQLRDMTRRCRDILEPGNRNPDSGG
ncbi:MAG: MerR family transcriptional regulator [Candidatus Eisenbacteria bacterium]|nr:MerR family transcriptional regulator [Candidatus Eisenbacteria bacterium]